MFPRDMETPILAPIPEDQPLNLTNDDRPRGQPLPGPRPVFHQPWNPHQHHQLRPLIPVHPQPQPIPIPIGLVHHGHPMGPRPLPPQPDPPQLTTFNPNLIPAPMITHQVPTSRNISIPQRVELIPLPNSTPPNNTPILSALLAEGQPALPPRNPMPPPPPPPLPEAEVTKKNVGALLTSLVLMVARGDGGPMEPVTDLILLQKKTKVEQVIGRLSQDNHDFRDYCYWLHERFLHLIEGKAADYYHNKRGLFPLTSYCVVEFPSKDGLSNVNWGLAMVHPSLVRIDPCPIMERGKSLRAKVVLKGINLRDHLGSPCMYGAITTTDTINVMRAQAERRFRCAHGRFIVPLRASLPPAQVHHPVCIWCPNSNPPLDIPSSARSRKRRFSQDNIPSVDEYDDPQMMMEQFKYIKKNRIQFFNLSRVREELVLAPVPSLAGILYPVIPCGRRPVEPLQETGLKEETGSPGVVIERPPVPYVTRTQAKSHSGKD